jgi:hypothetical protein
MSYRDLLYKYISLKKEYNESKNDLIYSEIKLVYKQLQEMEKSVSISTKHHKY